MGLENVDYGPLLGLIGSWQGDKGMDIAPEPDGAEHNPFYETIVFSPAGDVTNAESQLLAALHYRQIVQRKSNDEMFHDETGYWIWDAAAGVVMHSLTIPRGVSLIAGGIYQEKNGDNGDIVLEVAASQDSKDWPIIQAPFMRDNARTTEFKHRLQFGNGRLLYQETTIVDIYGNVFEHTDENQLSLQ